MTNDIDFQIKEGTGKSGSPYYMLTFTVGKYKSEPVFISELESDYLKNYQRGSGSKSRKIELED